MANYTLDLTRLDHLSFTELQHTKNHLDALRQRILALQNAQSPLLQLPGEIRNQIFLHAIYAELEERRRNANKKFGIFREPAFFATNRQIRRECIGIWLHDVLLWEELVDVPNEDEQQQQQQQQQRLLTPKIEVNVDQIEDVAARRLDSQVAMLECPGMVRGWKALGAEMVKELHSQRSKTGQLALVTERAHCDLNRLRGGIQSSRSVCRRKGLARVKGWQNGAPSLRWWTW